MKWTYTTAEFGCPRGCSFRSWLEPTVTWPYVGIVLVLSAALGSRLAASLGLGWFRALGVVAGEFLALFVAGIPFTLLRMATAPSSCEKCGEHMTLRGRYFTSTRSPRGIDWAILVILGVINAVVLLVVI